MVQLFTKELLAEQARNRRKTKIEASKRLPEGVKEQMLESLDTGTIPQARLAENFDLSQHIRPVGTEGKIAEFVGTGDFGTAWWERTRYEVDAGRDEEPILYAPIYTITEDASLPRMVKIETLGPAGVVFEQVLEGGEVKFASVGSGSKSIEMVHYGVGLEYSEDVFVYNELFRVAAMERRFGNAHNALLNHIHFNPILTYVYGAANQTDGTALTNFKVAARIEEKYARAVEAAMTNAIADTTNPRRGPYALLIGSGDALTMERALNRVPQQGFEQQTVSAINRIQSMIVYDGWTGTRGKKATSYAGVTSGKAYLIHIGNRMEDFQSLVKQALRMQTGNPDLARFILAKTVWDSRFGAFADPLRAVEEITLPTAASGAA